MKKIILIGIILLSQFHSNAQGNNPLIGKWKIITFDAMIFHDYRNDSTYYPPALLETLKGDKDSAFLVGFLDGMIKSFDNYYYVFNNNNEYQETKDGIIKQQGTYTINQKEQQVILVTKDKSGEETKQALQYELKDKILLFKAPLEEMEMKIQLIKSE